MINVKLDAHEKEELNKEIDTKEKEVVASIDGDNPFYLKVRDKLNGQGCGMCLNKWTQVTLHLQLGRTHSCHHPRTHPISTKEISVRNPSTLHNTRYKKLRRKEMLSGERPQNVITVGGVEDNSDRFSDRTFKSGESWSKFNR